jgi:hypothetical protein
MEKIFKICILSLLFLTIQVKEIYPHVSQGKTKIMHTHSFYVGFESISKPELTDCFGDQMNLFVDRQDRDSAPDLHSS